jgi:hypothetical protein
MNKTATAVLFALWYADETWQLTVRKEETLKIRSETKELSSRSVDELRGAEKSDPLKKTKNVKRDKSGRMVVEPKTRGTA